METMGQTFFCYLTALIFSLIILSPTQQALTILDNRTLLPRHEDTAPSPPEPYSPPIVYANFTQCQLAIRQEALPNFKPIPVDYKGRLLPPTTSINDTAVKGVDHTTCYAYCGSSSPKADWAYFSTQFSSWLLPFLALIAQFPYETGKTSRNLMSFFLMLGSPMFAMYCLSLTFLNSRWLRSETKRIFRQTANSHGYEDQNDTRFQGLGKLPEHLEVTLRYCQQEPLYLRDLRSENLNPDTVQHHVDYWEALCERIREAKRPYTASFVHQIAWVVVAFMVTIIDAFSNKNLEKNLTAFGLSIGLLWLWEVPVVFGWVVAGTLWREEAPEKMIAWLNMGWKNSAESETQTEVSITTDTSNSEGQLEAIGPTDEGERRQSTGTGGGVGSSSGGRRRRRGAMRRPPNGWPLETGPELEKITLAWASSKHDLHSRGPVFIYARPFTWSYNALTLLTSYARVYEPNQRPNNQWESQVKKRVVLASAFGLLLLWSTAGAAMVLNYNTPAKGLSCRSGGNLIYIVVSILVWALMVGSAWITDKPVTYNLEANNDEERRTGSPNRHEALPNRDLHIPLIPRTGSSQSSATDLTITGRREVPLNPNSPLQYLAMALRTLGKTLAILNAIWVVTHNLLEFLSVLNNCWCSTTQGLMGIPGVRHVWLWEGLADLKKYENVERTWQLVTAWACVVCGGGMGLIWGICKGFKRPGE